jgi:hypothetical protein
MTGHPFLYPSMSTPGIFPLLSILAMLGASSCDKPAHPDSYRYLGTALFRRSYAGHEKWTESQFDSVSRSNPEYIQSDARGDSALQILNDMGIVQAQELLLGDIDGTLMDTIIVAYEGSRADTVFIDKDTINWQMTIRVNDGTKTHRFPFEDVSSLFVAYLVPSRKGDHPFIAVLQQYYIMNGDNYEVAVYGKPDPR